MATSQYSAPAAYQAANEMLFVLHNDSARIISQNIDITHININKASYRVNVTHDLSTLVESILAIRGSL